MKCCVVGFKQLYQREGEPPPFFAASCELGLGLIPILGMYMSSHDQYQNVIYILHTDCDKYLNISEDEILAILREQAISDDSFSTLVTKLREKLENT